MDGWMNWRDYLPKDGQIFRCAGMRFRQTAMYEGGLIEGVSIEPRTLGYPLLFLARDVEYVDSEATGG